MNTPKGRQQWILDLLKNKPVMTHAECFGEFSAKFGRTERTFDKDWLVAQGRLKEYQKKLQKKKEEVSINKELKAVKRGLKTKIDRLLNYQKLVDDCLNDLAQGMTNDTIVRDGVPKSFRRKMTNYEYNQTRKTLKDLQSEISKIEGDYAPEKVDNNVKVKQIIGMIVK